MESISSNLNKFLINSNLVSNKNNNNKDINNPCRTNNSNTNPAIVSDKFHEEVKILNDQLEFTKRDHDSYQLELIRQDQNVAGGKLATKVTLKLLKVLKSYSLG